jgi:Flp pilus assembly protein TadG
MRKSLTLHCRRFAKLFARYCASDRATTAIEFAFVAPMIVALLLATLQVAVIYTAQSYLEALTESAMRIVLTNNAYALTQTQFNSQICASVTALFNCNGLIVQLTPAPTSAAAMSTAMPQFDSHGNLTAPPTFNPGTPNTKMMLVVMYQWPVVGGPLGLSFSNVGNGTHLLTSTEVFYIEPCTNANGCTSNG